MTRQQKIVEAIEAFIEAKLAYERADPEWRYSRDVNNARDHLEDALRDAFAVSVS